MVHRQFHRMHLEVHAHRPRQVSVAHILVPAVDQGTVHADKRVAMAIAVVAAVVVVVAAAAKMASCSLLEGEATDATLDPAHAQSALEVQPNRAFQVTTSWESVRLPEEVAPGKLERLDLTIVGFALADMLAAVDMLESIAGMLQDQD